MNMDLLFCVAIFSDFNMIINLISLNSYTKKIYTKYLFKIICQRDYPMLCYKVKTNNFTQKYVI